jgi:hypothetical protein
MDAAHFDRFTRGLARHLPRRGLLGGAGLAGIATIIGGRPGAAQDTDPSKLDDAAERQFVTIACTPCRCDEDGENCDCCLNGITGGGIVRTEVGDATLILFATELGDEAERQATGFVRWTDPTSEGGLVMESVGPIAYFWELDDAQAREIRGLMSINGEGEQPFVLHLIDSGLGAPGSDSARLDVGDLAAAEGDGSGLFGYTAAGPIVGGDIQLLETVAPVG